MSKCTKCGNEILTGDIHWEMGLCNNCYNELYKDHKTYISLDKMWLNIAQRFRDENEKLQDKVADLEAKLAEYEKFMKDNGFKNLEELDHYIQKIHSHYDEVKNKGTCGLCEKLDNELINQLKQQLAEKDKEIERWKEQYFTEIGALSYAFNQAFVLDKISFAVEQLEKVKKFINEKYQYLLELEKQGNLTEHGKGSKLTNEIVLQKLHNQIEELKKEMK